MKDTGILAAIPEGPRERLMALGHEMSFPAGTRIFEEGGRADRFWIIHTGGVNLDIHVPGRRAAVVETLGAGRLLGWSWLCPPHQWHLGAEATSPVRAWEFNAAEVLELCERDHELDHALLAYVIEVIGRRLRAARTRLLDQLPTLVTSNLPVGDLRAQIGDRVASRLAGMCEQVVFTGSDRRRHGNAA